MTRRTMPWVALSVAAVAASTIITPSLAAPTSAPTRKVAASTVTLLGPSKARITEPVIAVIADPQPGDTYTWDLDDNGSFETYTGLDPWAQAAYHRGGTRTVSVAVDGPGGARTATLDVKVTRPEVAKLVMTPANPGPGQDVTFTVVSRTDRKSPLRAFTWDVEAIKSTRKKVEVRSNKGGKSVPGGLEHVLSTNGLGKDVTKGASVTLRMPKQAGRTLDVNVEAITLTGDKIELRRSVTLRSAVTSDPYPAGETIDCASVPEGVPSWPCAAISYGESVADVDTAFVNATPGVEVCTTEPDVTTGGSPKIVGIQENQNLGYPTPESFFAAGGFGTIGGLQEPKAARVTTYSLGTKKKCKTMNPVTISWDFGDGTGVQTPSPVVDSTWPYPHRYDEAGTYTVTLVTKVPYLVGEGNALSNLKYFTAMTTTVVEVQESFCGTLMLSGIPIATRHPLASPSTPNGCFVPMPGIDGTTLYRPAAGFDLNLNGVHIKGQNPVVNPDAGVITASTGTLVGTLSVFEGGASSVARRLIEPTATIVVPPPTYDPTIGDVVSALPAVNFDPTDPVNQVTGLGVETGQLLLSPVHRASERLSLRMPPPVSGQPTLIFGGNGDVLNPSPSARSAGEARSAKTLSGDTDFEINLADTQVGAFYIRSGIIGHRITGGWYGGVQLDVDGLGTLDAPYLPPGASTADCETADGPSGLELGAGGGFKFAGAVLKPDPNPIPIGPIGLNCVAIKGAADPFIMVGKAKLTVPAGGDVAVNACLATSVVNKGQTVSGCGNTLKAPMDLVWFRADGTLTLFDALDLANGYFDTRVGDGYSAIKFGGKLDYTISEFGLVARVDGTAIVQPDFQFDLIGGAELCAVLCVDTQAGVSSVGFGACASLGGFVYYWDGNYDLFAFSCDLKEKIGVKQSLRTVQGLPTSVIKVPAGQDKVGFEVSAAADNPVLKIIRPNGTVIKDTGVTSRGRGYLINHLPDQGVVAVTITNPLAGNWKIQETSEGQPATVRLFTEMKAPTVTGDVVSKGTKRTLKFSASMDVNDEVVFYETSALGQRRLAGGYERGAGQTLVIPRAGAAGKRTVTAIVLRNGIPYKKIVVDEYVAPAARQLQAPTDVLLTPDGAGTLIAWTGVGDATTFEVTGSFTDGRTFTHIVTDEELYVPGVGEFAKGSVSVRAIDPNLRPSGVTGRVLTPPKRITIVM